MADRRHVTVWTTTFPGGSALGQCFPGLLAVNVILSLRRIRNFGRTTRRWIDPSVGQDDTYARDARKHSARTAAAASSGLRSVSRHVTRALPVPLLEAWRAGAWHVRAAWMTDCYSARRSPNSSLFR